LAHQKGLALIGSQALNWVVFVLDWMVAAAVAVALVVVV